MLEVYIVFKSAGEIDIPFYDTLSSRWSCGRSTSCMYELTVTVIMKQKLTTRSSIALEKCEILAIHNYWMDFISSLTEWSCRASCRAELHDV